MKKCHTPGDQICGFRDVSPQAIPSFSHRLFFFFRTGQHTRQQMNTTKQETNVWSWGEFLPGMASIFSGATHSSFQHQQLEFFNKNPSNHSQIKSVNPPPTSLIILMDHSISLRIQTKQKVPYPPPCWVRGSKLLPHLDLSVHIEVSSRII